MIPIGRPSEAIDPVALFIAIIVIVNIISAFTRQARQRRAAAMQQQQSSAPLQPSRLDDAMRKAASDVAAARQAQRARMEQAIRAAQARLQQQMPASQPVVVTQGPPRVAAAQFQPAPPASEAPPQAESLPTFEFAQDMPVATQLPSAQPAGQPVTVRVLGSQLTGNQLFVAAAIVGPPAALRSSGHTPAGW